MVPVQALYHDQKVSRDYGILFVLLQKHESSMTQVIPKLAHTENKKLVGLSRN